MVAQEDTIFLYSTPSSHSAVLHIGFCRHLAHWTLRGYRYQRRNNNQQKEQ